MIKKLILLGLGLTLLIGLPLTIFVLQQQTQPVTKAAPVTKFSFSGPAQVASGTKFDENLVVDPSGQNQLSFVKFTFTYDPNFLDTGASSSAVTIASQFTALEQPSVTCTTLCTVTATLSVGSNQNAIIKSSTTIATIHFTAKVDTDTNGTQLLFVSGQNQALSVSTSDQAAENVFQSGVPKTIFIGTTTTTGGGGTGGTTPSVSPSPTDATGTAGTGDGGGGTGTGGTGGVITSGATTGVNGTTVACSSLTANPTSGQAPLAVTFTTVGSSPNDSISQLVLSYGDGSSDTVATGSGIGTGDLNNQITHTYSGNGQFTAKAQLTTEGGATSDPSTCQATIVVGTNVAQATASANPPGELLKTGPGDTFMLLGAAGVVVTALGLFIVAGL